VRGVRAVLAAYLARPPGDFAADEVGFAHDGTEQRRRWLVKSLLRAEGTSTSAWQERFGDAMPALEELRARGWRIADGEQMRLSEGLAIEPGLVSGTVRRHAGPALSPERSCSGPAGWPARLWHRPVHTLRTPVGKYGD
jgi:oxygen-independent coproporphyrinogen-3 oxidase